jgi:hypothetical protein
MTATCTTRFILLNPIVTIHVSYEEYILRSSTLWNFLQPYVTYFILDPDILLALFSPSSVYGSVYILTTHPASYPMYVTQEQWASFTRLRTRRRRPRAGVLNPVLASTMVLFWYRIVFCDIFINCGIREVLGSILGPGDRLSWLMVFVAFLSLSRRMSG